MKRNSLLLATIGIFLCLLSCKKDDLEELATPAPPPAEIMSVEPKLRSTSLEIGINGHPLGTRPYTSIPASEQINLLKQMGMSIYRIDVQSRNNDGRITVPGLYNPLKKAADTAGIKLLPVLIPRTLNFKNTEAESYRWGRALGAKFARRYRSDFTYYNIANELDNRCILPFRTGDKESDYNLRRFKIIAAYLKGMNDGIKAMDPDAKTIINAGWMHYEYLLMLERYGVKFDIVGYQWYDEMEILAALLFNIHDITTFLSSKFTKPIWFTEFNARDKFGILDERIQSDFIRNFLEKCQNNPQVHAAIIYQLFNEPQKFGQEAHYGIFKWLIHYTQYTPKIYARQALVN
ncbi:MAG TPA: glycosyl hydrolase [Pseudosphingobacterium sp.]|nr:glycosyl hydrolase [Pseudosphingobacterium sp.]